MSEWAENFAAALVRARGRKSQVEFAQFLGISSQQSYSRYERGQFPDGEVLLKIALKLGLTVEELLTGNPAVRPAEAAHLVMSEEVVGYKTDTGLDTPDLERRIAELAASLEPERRPLVKEVLMDRLLADVHELKKRYVLEREQRQLRRAEKGKA